MVNISEFIKNKVRTVDFWLALVFFVAFFIFYMSLNGHCLWVDETRDLMITENLIKTGVPAWGGELEVYHPPLYYFALAIPSFITGATELTGNFVVSLFGALSVALTYLIGKKAFNQRVGIFAAIMFSVIPLQIFLSTRILYHTTLTFFVVAAIYFFVRWTESNDEKELYISAFLLGLTLMIQYTVVGLILAMILFTLVFKRKHIKNRMTIVKTVGVLGIVTLPWLIISAFSVIGSSKYGSLLNDIFLSANPLNNMFNQPWFYYIINMPSFVDTATFLLFILGIFATFILVKKREYLWLFLAVILGIILVPSIVTFKDARYILHALPFICIIAGVGLDKIYRIIHTKSPLLSKLVIFIILLFIVITSGLGGMSFVTGKAAGFCGLKEAGTWIDQYTQNDKTIFVGSSTELSWFSKKYPISDVIQPFPAELDTFKAFESNKSVSFVEVDAWEYTQPEYTRTYFMNNSNYKPVFVWPNVTQVAVIIFEYVNNTTA